MSSFHSIQNVMLPPSICEKLLQLVRDNSHKFQRINEEEEPPLRTLDHGLYGEFIKLGPTDPDPYPFVIRKPEGDCFHGYRFDQSVLHEFLHKSEYLQSRCGPFDPNTGSPFRQVLTYSASVDGGALEDDAMSNQVIGELKEILIPAVLKVFGETDNVEAKMATKMFSIYTNLLFPGNVVKVHLDVPQFIGLDRSTCPSWLLVAANCSGLFSEYRVKNVTCVCYPQDANGGELVVYNGRESGKIYPVKKGASAIMDADSLFHQVAQVRPNNMERDKIISGPDFPTHCRLKVEKIDGIFWWSVVDMSGKSLSSFKEEDLRFSISCKFHVFHDQNDAEKFESKEKKLTAEEIINILTEDLKMKNILKKNDKLTLFDLAPILVNEYILPCAPTSEIVESVWRNYEKNKI